MMSRFMAQGIRLELAVAQVTSGYSIWQAGMIFEPERRALSAARFPCERTRAPLDLLEVERRNPRMMPDETTCRSSIWRAADGRFDSDRPNCPDPRLLG